MYERAIINKFLTILCFSVIVILATSYIIFNKVIMPYEILLFQILLFLFFIVGILILYSLTLNSDQHQFKYIVFFVALLIKVLGVFVYYNIFLSYNGVPNQLIGSDSVWYNEQGVLLSKYYLNKGDWNLFSYFDRPFSDFGYSYFTAIVYSLFGNNIVVIRIIQAIISSITVVYVYKLAKCYFTEQICRLSAIVVLFFPIFTQYASDNYKETLFILLVVLAVYHSQKLMITTGFNVFRIFVIIGLLFSLFAFRTGTGIMCSFSIFLSILIGKSDLPKWGIFLRVFILPVITILLLYILFLSPAKIELENAVDTGNKYSDKVLESTNSVTLKSIATIPLFFVSSFFVPLPNLVELPGDDDKIFAEQMLSADSLLKGLFGFFAFFGIIQLIRQSYRKYLLILSIFLSNLFMIAYAGVAFNYRHHLPIMVFFIILAMAGLFNMKKNLWIYYYFYIILYLIVVLWFNYTKLSDFGIIV